MTTEVGAMSFFTQVFSLVPSFYLAEQLSGDRGFLALVLGPGAIAHPPDLTLERAFKDETLEGSFVFSALPPPVSTEDQAKVFVKSIQGIVQSSPVSRGFIWLQDRFNITADTAPLMGFGYRSNEGLIEVKSGLSAPLTQSLTLQVQTGMLLTLDGTLLTLGDGSGPQILFSGPSSPAASPVTTGLLDFSGALRGCIRFDVFIQRLSLGQKLYWGFQFLFPDSSGLQPTLSEWLPFGSEFNPNATDMLGFNACIDPSDVYNTAFDPCLTSDACNFQPAYDSRRTYFNFTGLNRDESQTLIASYYRTIYGAQLTLVPVGSASNRAQGAVGRLVFSPGQKNADNSEEFHLSPEGDFTIRIAGAADGESYDLLCGLQGTEFLSFQPQSGSYSGDRLRFLSRQPAFASNFPFAEASPVGPPMDPAARLLDKTFTTSWNTVVRGSSEGNIHYVAQPKGSSLFGQDELIHNEFTSLMGQESPGYILPQSGTLTFPMPPYAGMVSGGQGRFSPEQSETFERQVIGATRRNMIGAATQTLSRSAKASLKGEQESKTSNVTTPSGLIATITCQEGGGCKWDKILLGQNQNPAFRQMYFAEPKTKLQQAFQTNDLFLVVANAQNLGTLAGKGAPSGSAFYNQMNIEDWVLEAKVGQTSQYADYTNVIIVKGRKGKLYDPAGPSQDNLVANPDKWTQRNEFASPTTMNNQTPDPGQLVNLSQWLQDYFLDASKQPDTGYFGKFNSIAIDPNWTGILILKMDISKIPTNLVGIMAGIQEPQLFNAHHFAIEVSQVKQGSGGVQMVDSSSMFGLIYYVDPTFIPPVQGGVVEPSAPPAGVDYDFRVLTLKVLFENTAVRDFESYAQITLNKFFDMSVDHMGEGGNPYNTIVLSGSYQNNNGQPIYNLGTTADYTFYFNSNIINKIEIDSARMSTRNSDLAATIVAWFALAGFIDYKIVQQGATAALENLEGPSGVKSTETDPGFDIFSFGNPDGQDYTRRGLAFSNLGLQMTFTSADDRVFTFKSDEISFDIATSTPRPDSLFINFALTLQGLQTGNAETPPTKSGYLNVVTSARLTGVDGGQWYGLRYQLNMGTPGDLAGKVNLTSYLVTAWSPQSPVGEGYRAMVGISLPGTGGGAKLISLQTVLSLSIGQIWLVRATDQNSFLLMLTEIALKFLGILKIPPSGSTLFYLFGNPQSEGKPSGLGWYAMYKQQAKQALLVGQ